MKVVQVGTVALGDECALHQRGASDFAPTLGDAPDTQTIVGPVNARRHAEEGGKVAAFCKVPNIDDVAQQYGRPDFSNPLDRYQVLIARKRLGGSGNFRLRLLILLNEKGCLGGDSFQLRPLQPTPFMQALAFAKPFPLPRAFLPTLMPCLFSADVRIFTVWSRVAMRLANSA